MRVVMMGPPGAGKGTQATVVAEQLGVPHISTGDIFRANAGRGTGLGLLARSFMERGEYVPDEVTNQMVAERLAAPDAAEGFLLDGYPRTLDQVAALDEMLAQDGKAVDKVVELTADLDEVIARLLKRALEQGRVDDTEEVIRRRMEVYGEQTAPLTDLYSSRGLLLRVDGMGAIEVVRDRILAALQG